MPHQQMEDETSETPVMVSPTDVNQALIGTLTLPNLGYSQAEATNMLGVIKNGWERNDELPANASIEDMITLRGLVGENGCLSDGGTVPEALTGFLNANFVGSIDRRLSRRLEEEGFSAEQADNIVNLAHQYYSGQDVVIPSTLGEPQFRRILDVLERIERQQENAGPEIERMLIRGPASIAVPTRTRTTEEREPDYTFSNTYSVTLPGRGVYLFTVRKNEDGTPRLGEEGTGADFNLEPDAIVQIQRPDGTYLSSGDIPDFLDMAKDANTSFSRIE